MSYLTHNGVLAKLSPQQLKTVLDLASVVIDSTNGFISDAASMFLEKEGIDLPVIDPDVFSQSVITSRLICRELDISPGTQAIIVNGRVRFFAV